jgi:hypothetical protein
MFMCQVAPKFLLHTVSVGVHKKFRRRDLDLKLMLDVESMKVEDKYEGPRMENGKVTLKFMQVGARYLTSKPTMVLAATMTFKFFP